MCNRVDMQTYASHPSSP